MSIREIEAKAKELRELKRMAEELSAEITAIEDEIKAHMTAANADTLTAGEYRITWKEVSSSRFDSTRFKKDHADLAAAYTKVTTCRRFLVH